jgi:hypothetical protein
VLGSAIIGFAKWQFMTPIMEADAAQPDEPDEPVQSHRSSPVLSTPAGRFQ